MVVEVELVGHQLEARQQLAAERRERTPEPTRRTAAGNRADVGVEVVTEHLHESFESAGEHLDLSR